MTANIAATIKYIILLIWPSRSLLNDECPRGGAPAELSDTAKQVTIAV